MSTQAAAPHGNTVDTVKTAPTDVEIPQSEAEIDELTERNRPSRRRDPRGHQTPLRGLPDHRPYPDGIGWSASGAQPRDEGPRTIQRAGPGRPHSRDAAPAPGPRTPGPLAHTQITCERPHRMPLAVPMWPFACVSALERDVLRVQVFLDPLGPALAAESGFLHATERRCRVRDHSAVDADHS